MGKPHKLYLLLALLPSFALAEQTKTVFNPFTGKLDYITTLTSGTLPSGSTQYIQNRNTLQSGATFYVSSGTAQSFNATTVNITGLTSGLCVQTGTGGSLTTAAAACGSGSGGGSSTLAIATGTVAGFTNLLSSPTAAINFSNANFIGSFVPGATAFITLNPSSVTLQGNTGLVSLASTQTWTGLNNWTTPGISTFTYGLVVGTITTTALGNIISNNGKSQNSAGSLLSVFWKTSALNNILMTVGSDLQADQFTVKDSKPVSFNVFGVQGGDLFVGKAGATQSISTDQEATQFINWWNAGEMDIQTALAASLGKDIVLKPATIEQLRLSGLTGMTVSSSMTVTGAGIAVSTITFSPGATFASLPAAPNGTIRYCSDCAVSIPATCTANLVASCVCAGSGSGAFAKRINGTWYCD